MLSISNYYIWERRHNILIKKIESLCNEKGITFYKLSKDTGISVQTLSACKKRNGSMSADNLKTIAKYFEKPMEYFLEERENN